MNQFGTGSLAGGTGTVHALLMMRVMGIGWVSCALVLSSCGGATDGQVSEPERGVDCVFGLPTAFGSTMRVGASARPGAAGWVTLFWLEDSAGTGERLEAVVESTAPPSHTFEGNGEPWSVTPLSLALDVERGTATLSQGARVLASDISCTPR